MESSGGSSPSGYRSLPSIPGVARVAIVDDHAPLRKVLTRALETVDRVEVVGEASDGTDAIDLLDRARPNVLVIDLQVPGLNGIEAMQAIKARFPDVIVVVFSSDASLRAEALAAGAATSFPKGTGVSALVDYIQLVVIDSVPPELASFPTPVRDVISKATTAAAVTLRRGGELPLIVYVNGAFTELTGYESTDVIGRSVDFWLALGVPLDEWTAIGTLLRAGKLVEKDVMARRKDGGHVPVRFTMTPFFSDDDLHVITLITPTSSSEDPSP